MVELSLNNVLPFTSRFAVGADEPIPIAMVVLLVGGVAVVPAAPVSVNGEVVAVK